GLDFLPLHDHVGGGAELGVLAEDMRVAAHEFFVRLGGDGLEVEVPILLGDLRMEDHLHEHVAELLAHVRTIQPVDGVEQFADLVDQATGQAGVRLFPIPRTASRGAQGGNGFSKTFNSAHESGTCPRNTRNTRKFFGFVFRVFRVFRGPRMSDQLPGIMEWKRREVAARARPVSLDELASLNAALPPPPSFARALRRTDGALAVISEIKRRSPSAGDIKAGASA